MHFPKMFPVDGRHAESLRRYKQACSAEEHKSSQHPMQFVSPCVITKMILYMYRLYGTFEASAVNTYATPDHPCPSYLSCAPGNMQVGLESSPSLQRNHKIFTEVVYHLVTNSTLVVEVLRQSFHQSNLLLRREAGDCCLQDATHTGFVLGNEALIVHEAEETHDELTIHTICHATVSRNGVAEVLDIECALEA